MYSVLAATITSILIGYAYETFGRKKVLVMLLFLQSALLAMLPNFSSEATIITFVRIATAMVVKSIN